MSGLPKEEDVIEAPVVTPDEPTPGKIGNEVEINPEPKEELKTDADDNVEIEVIDPRAPQDRREPIKEQDKVGADKDIDKELEGLKTQGAKRIQELKHQVHDQRRLKEAAEREREAAVRFASSVRERLMEERKRSAEIEKVAYEQALAKARAELESAKRDHKQAYEVGDADKIADATTRMARAAQDEQRFQYAQPAPVEAPPEFRQDPRQQIPDQRALEWARKNEWFKMENGAPANPESAVAYSIHVALVQQGIDPTAADGKYYQELDRRLKAVYPEKFAGNEEDQEPQPVKAKTPRQPSTPVVAPATRSAPGPKKVTLTQDEVALAKRLNVPLEEFAKHKLMIG
jgi:hypothetical protein